jgi:hypothetical protein
MPTTEAVLPTHVKMTVPEVEVPKPQLTWISGTIQQILVQEKENFYVLTVNDGKTTYNPRFGDPYTGQCSPITAQDPMFWLVTEAFFNKQSVYLGVRDFGYDPQAGIEKLIIDRVSLYHL